MTGWSPPSESTDRQTGRVFHAAPALITRFDVANHLCFRPALSSLYLFRARLLQSSLLCDNYPY
ncbi:hypothetical protein ACTXT7_004577 [Hymenolepis weldensis]